MQLWASIDDHAGKCCERDGPHSTASCGRCDTKRCPNVAMLQGPGLEFTMTEQSKLCSCESSSSVLWSMAGLFDRVGHKLIRRIRAWRIRLELKKKAPPLRETSSKSRNRIQDHERGIVLLKEDPEPRCSQVPSPLAWDSRSIMHAAASASGPQKGIVNMIERPTYPTDGICPADFQHHCAPGTCACGDRLSSPPFLYASATSRGALESI